MEDKMIYKLELTNKVRNGQSVGNLYGIGKYLEDGRRCGWELPPQESEEQAKKVLAEKS
jgi:hypothetical protein